MPTNHDETLHERYAREHQTDLEIYARMTPEQIHEMAIDLHNALSKLDKLESRQSADAGSRDLLGFFNCCKSIVEQLEDSPKSAFSRLCDAVNDISEASSLSAKP